MTHEHVVAGGVVDAYAAGTLSVADREAFEEHMFVCDECFAELQAADGLRSGVRHLAARGALDETVSNVRAVPPAAVPVSNARSLAPWLALAATIALAVGVTVTQQQRYADLEQELSGTRDRSAQLQASLDRARAEAAERARILPEANLPVAILQTVRSSGPALSLALPPGVSRFVVWIEDPPQLTADTAMTLSRSDGTGVAAVSGLRLNEQRAVVASFPAATLSDGSYVVRLVAGGRTLAEYGISIVKR